MPKLFLIYLGGRAPNANIELHDVQFVAADSIEDTFGELRQRWFGTVQGLHLDAYVEVKFVDGFRIELRRDPSAQPEKLYFVNLGGYDPASVAELHQFGLFVATTAADAKSKAKESLLTRSVQQHKDDLFDVDDCVPIGQVAEYFVHLVPDSRTRPFVPDWFGYRVIG
jgi:Domain of Unknown Function (DUF1543)